MNRRIRQKYGRRPVKPLAALPLPTTTGTVWADDGLAIAKAAKQTLEGDDARMSVPARMPRCFEETAKHIRKLRWIGMDEEAHALERALENGRIAMLKAVRCSLGPLDAG